MARTFATRQDVDGYTEYTSPIPVRFVGRCQVCGVGAAVSVPGRWVASQDLFGVWRADVEPDGVPSGDRCGHGAVRWERVVLGSGALEDCSETCRDALGASCSCSCFARSHGSNHRVRTSSAT